MAKTVASTPQATRSRLRDGRSALFRFDYSFNPVVTLSNFVQYDTAPGNIGLQNRLRWIVKPGNEVFLVLNHSSQEDILDRLEAVRTDVRAKVNYTLRFGDALSRRKQ